MLKSELIARIAEQNPHLYERDAEAIVNAILDTITTALARGDRVELRGFGVFAVKRRAPGETPAMVKRLRYPRRWSRCSRRAETCTSSSTRAIHKDSSPATLPFPVLHCRTRLLPSGSKKLFCHTCRLCFISVIRGVNLFAPYQRLG